MLRTDIVFDVLNESEENESKINKLFKDNQYVNILPTLNQSDTIDNDKKIFKSLKKSYGVIYVTHSHLGKKTEVDIISKLLRMRRSAKGFKYYPLIILSLDEPEYVESFKTKIVERINRKITCENFDFRWFNNEKSFEIFNSQHLVDNDIVMVTISDEFLNKFLENLESVCRSYNLSYITHMLQNKSYKGNRFTDLDSHYATNSYIHKVVEDLLQYIGMFDDTVLHYLLNHGLGIGMAVKSVMSYAIESNLIVDDRSNYDRNAKEHVMTFIEILINSDYFISHVTNDPRIFLICLFICVGEENHTLIEKIINNKEGICQIYRKIACLNKYSKKNLMMMQMDGSLTQFSDQFENLYPGAKRTLNNYLSNDRMSLYGMYTRILDPTKMEVQYNMLDAIDKNETIIFSEMNMSDSSDSTDDEVVVKKNTKKKDNSDSELSDDEPTPSKKPHYVGTAHKRGKKKKDDSDSALSDEEPTRGKKPTHDRPAIKSSYDSDPYDSDPYYGDAPKKKGSSSKTDYEIIEEMARKTKTAKSVSTSSREKKQPKIIFSSSEEDEPAPKKVGKTEEPVAKKKVVKSDSDSSDEEEGKDMYQYQYFYDQLYKYLKTNGFLQKTGWKVVNVNTIINRLWRGHLHGKDEFNMKATVYGIPISFINHNGLLDSKFFVEQSVKQEKKFITEAEIEKVVEKKYQCSDKKGKYYVNEEDYYSMIEYICDEINTLSDRYQNMNLSDAKMKEEIMIYAREYISQ